MEDQWYNLVSFLLSLWRLPDQLSLTSMSWILWYLTLKRLTWIVLDLRPFSPFRAAQTLNLISTLNVSLLFLFRAGSPNLSTTDVLGRMPTCLIGQWGCPVYWRAFSSIPGRSPLHASLLRVVTTKSVSRHSQMSPWTTKSYLFEKVWFREILLILKSVLYFKTVVLTDCEKPGKYRKY